MFNRQCMMIAALASWTLASAIAQTTTTAPATRTLDLPPFGLGSTETARVNLTNTATASSAGTAASCVGSVSFLNASGATIGAATSFTIASGQTSSASLPFNSAAVSGTRGEIRAVVQITRSATAPTPCSLLLSLSTFDTTSGVTHLFLTGSEGFGGFQAGPGGR